jgi:uncharacterized membrane protein
VASRRRARDRADTTVRRVVLALLVPAALATLVGLVLLWPTDPTPQIPAGEVVSGTVLAITPCPDLPEEQCLRADVEITSGADEGMVFSVGAPVGAGAPTVEPGDRVVLQTNQDAPPDQRYVIADFERRGVLLALAGAFAVAVVVLARWRGVFALVGLASSLAVLVLFVLPAVLQGSPPLLVAVVGAATIAFLTMLLAHGPSLRTGVALLGVLASLLLTAGLGAAVIELGEFTGLADEASVFLPAFVSEVDPRGLLLAGLVIGALGVLDDVTITQAAAVAEIHAADPGQPRRQLLQAGLRVGRDHVAATVNTLVLAYAGAALPLLLLFLLSRSAWGQVLTDELVAQEVVRTLVGAIGIVAAVPLTTALAAALFAATPGYPGRSSPDGAAAPAVAVAEPSDPSDPTSGESGPRAY